MTTVLPIRGLRFDHAAGLDFSKVITPPYDIITRKMQDGYYKKSPYNVIRLEYSKSFPEDSDNENKYTRAAAILRDWLEKGILIKEEKPAFYLYEQQFSYNQKDYIRKGLYCGVGLSPFKAGKIIPHEETLSSPKADRLELLRHCETNFSPIFGLYKDKGKMLDGYTEAYKKEQEPVIAFEGDDRQLHKIWIVTDPHLIQVIKRFFKDKKIYIADGHHRYETALQFYLEKKESGQDIEKYDHVLMSLVNSYDEGLLVFPTHRVITKSDIDSAGLLERLGNHFSIKELPPVNNREKLHSFLDEFLAGATDENLTFGLYTPEQKLFILTLKKLAEEEKPYPWLDTVVLQELVLSNIFGLDETERRKESGLCYLRDEWEAKQKADQSQACFVFYLNEPPIEEILNLAEKGVRLPQKSTYFSPKFVTGLVMLQLGDA